MHCKQGILVSNQSLNSVGCELPSKARSNLRAAIKTLLFIQFAACATAASASPESATLDTVQVVGVQIPRFPVSFQFSLIGVSWGGYDSAGYDSGGSEDPPEEEAKDPKPHKPVDGCKKSSEFAAVRDNPVDMITGMKLHYETDFASRSNAGLEFKRMYNQAWPGSGLMGSMWITNLDLKLSFDSAWGETGCYPSPGAGCSADTPSFMYAHRDDGNIIKFTYDPIGGKWQGSEEVPLAAIVKQADGTFKLSWPDGGYEIYLNSGFIAQRKGADNVGLTYTYDASGYLQRVTHTSGRSIQLTYVSGALDTVTDPAGAVYTYKHATASLLTRVVFPDRRGTMIYHYEDAFGLLTGYSIGIADRIADYVYLDGKVVHSQKHNGADSKDYAYFADRIERTNSYGQKTTYTVVDGRITDVTGSPTANCPASFSSRTFDAEGRQDIVIDASGNATDFDYDTNGRLSQVVEAVGTPAVRTTQMVWSPTTGLVTKVIVVGVNETSYTYDAANRVKTVAVKNLMNGVLNQVRTVAYNYTTHPNGMLATVQIDGPVAGTGDAVTYAYSALGDLLSVTNGLGHVAAFSNYNALGLAGRTTSPNGAVTDYTYDVRGRPLSVSPIVNGSAQPTLFKYDQEGRLLSVEAPDGQLRTFDYDQIGRLIQEAEPEGDSQSAQTEYVYNLNSQPVEVTRQRLSP